MTRNGSAHFATATVLALLFVCATPVFNQASKLPISATTLENMGAPTDFAHRNAIFLSLSGGGLRAAAFSYGVFIALDELKREGAS